MCALLASTAAADDGTSSTRARDLRVDVAVVDAMASFDLDGVVVIAGRDGRIELARGWGYLDAAAAVPALPDVVFRLEEPNELLTVAAVLALVDDGVLSLGDPVGELLEELAALDRGLTLEHLINHTSGLPDDVAGAIVEASAGADDASTSARRITAGLADVALEFEPGHRCEVSDTALMLARLIVERAAGRTFRDFVEINLFDPARLATTELCSAEPRAAPAPPADTDPSSAAGEPQRDGAAIGPLPLRPLVCSSAEDLFRWQAALFTTELLGEASQRRLVTPVALADGSVAERAAGYAIGEPDKLLVATSGGLVEDAEQRCQLARYPDSGLQVVVLLRGGSCPAETVQRRVARALLDLIEVDDFDVPLLPEQRDAFAGEYQLVSSPVEVVRNAGDGLDLRWMGTETFSLRYRGNATFDVPSEAGTLVRFAEVREGACQVLELERGGQVSVARRVD